MRIYIDWKMSCLGVRIKEIKVGNVLLKRLKKEEIVVGNVLFKRLEIEEIKIGNVLF